MTFRTVTRMKTISVVSTLDRTHLGDPAAGLGELPPVRILPSWLCSTCCKQAARLATVSEQGTGRQRLRVESNSLYEHVMLCKHAQSTQRPAMRCQSALAAIS